MKLIFLAFSVLPIIMICMAWSLWEANDKIMACIMVALSVIYGLCVMAMVNTGAKLRV